MGWFADMIGGSVIKDTLAGADNLFTSDEERLQWETKKVEIEAQLEQKVMEAEEKINEHVTARHKADMQSDSKLSKNIRPVSLCIITGGLCLIIILSYCGFNLEKSLVSLVGDAWKLVLMFYFGGRSAEKGVKMIASALRKK